MTDEDLYRLMSGIVKTVTGVPTCIMGNPDRQAPAGPYAAIVVNQAVNQRGQANIRRSNSPGRFITVDVRAQIIAECSIQFYRTGARQFARKLHQANKRPDVSATLYKARVGWNRTGSVNNLTALQAANEYEERAQVSVFVMYETSDPVVINSIEGVNIEVDDAKGRDLATFKVLNLAAYIAQFGDQSRQFKSASASQFVTKPDTLTYHVVV